MAARSRTCACLQKLYIIVDPVGSRDEIHLTGSRSWLARLQTASGHLALRAEKNRSLQHLLVSIELPKRSSWPLQLLVRNGQDILLPLQWQNLGHRNHSRVELVYSTVRWAQKARLMPGNPRKRKAVGLTAAAPNCH